MITSERTHDGTLVLSALVLDKVASRNPWGSPWYCRRMFQGYTLKEAKALYRESLTRDGLVIVKN